MKFKLPFGGANLIGIDLGTQSVKVVQLAPAGQSFSVLKTGQLAIASATPGEISSEERTRLQAQALKTLMDNLKLKPRLCATSVSGSSVIIRFIKPAKMTAADLQKTIQFEAEPNIPFNIAEVALSFQILADVVEDNQAKMETALVAAKTDLIQSRIDALDKSGIKPAVIDVDSFCVHNVYEKGLMVPGESVMLINIGAMTTNLIIVENGMIKMVRDVFVAGINFTKSIQKQLQIDFPTAEALKVKHGMKYISETEISSAQDITEEEYNVVGTLLPAIRELITEVQRSIDYYQAQAGDRAISRLILSGGGASMKNIDRFFKSELSVETVIFDPFAKMKQAAGSQKPELLPAYCVAAGLAMRSL